RRLRRPPPVAVLRRPARGRAEGPPGLPHREHAAQPGALRHARGLGADGRALRGRRARPHGGGRAPAAQPVRRLHAGLLRQARAQRPQARPARRQRRLPAPALGRGRPARVRARRRHGERLRGLRRRGAGPRPGPVVSRRTLRGAAALVGVADAASPTGELDTHGRALEAAMVHEALADAGLTLDDVDGVAYAGSAAGLAEFLGIRPRYLDGTLVGGSSYELHVEHAAAAIAAGLCDVVVGVYAATPRSDRRRPGGGGRRGMPPGPNPALEWELPYGLRLPIGGYALAASRHMAVYGTTPE